MSASAVARQAALAARSGRPYLLRPDPADGIPERDVKDVLDAFLERIGQKGLREILAYCVLELYYNALKANMKRCWFLKKGWDIGNARDYERGMASFKRQALVERGMAPCLPAEYGFYAVVGFSIEGNGIRISVRNNAVMTPEERERVRERIVRSYSFSSLEEAMRSIDETEGAGLGIHIIVLALKKLGFPKESFSVNSENDETIARLVVPASDEWTTAFMSVADRVIQYINGLPDLPENIRRLRRLISDTAAELPEIAKFIAEDPSLSAETLRLANSAAYGVRKKTGDIVEAVMRIGLRGLHLILTAYGVKTILGNNAEFIRKLWERSNRTARVAREIAKRNADTRPLVDDAYAGGLLLELGTLILYAVHKDAETRVRRFADEKGISPAALEELLAGVNSAEVGALAAEKWDFPPMLVETIRFRGATERVSAPYRILAEIVCAADCVSRYAESSEAYAHFDRGILAKYGFSDEAAVRKASAEAKTYSTD